MTWSPPIVCLVTDRHRLHAARGTWRDECVALLRFCEQAIDAGVSMIQLRERDVDGRSLTALARELVGVAAGSSTTIVISDRADIARAAGADGVHLRADSVPASRLCGWGGDRWTIGRSTHAVAEVAAERAVDYLLFGTVFPTRSKPGHATCGVDGLGAAVRAAVTPVLAIGGITAERAAKVAAVGAAGIAGIGVFLPPGHAPEALGPADAVRAIREAFDRAGSVT